MINRDDWRKKVMEGRIVVPPDDDRKKAIRAYVEQGHAHFDDPETGLLWECPFCDHTEGFYYDRGFQRCLVCMEPGQ